MKLIRPAQNVDINILMKIIHCPFASTLEGESFLACLLFSNTFDDKYRSPRSQIIVTITPWSSFWANLTAAAIAPPLLTPAKIASSFANLIIIYSASSWDTFIMSSTRSLLNIFGRYSGAHLRIPGIFAFSSGCTPIIWISGFFYFKNILVPIIVPVVPIDDTKWVIVPWVSLYIYGPVVL